MDGEAPPRRLAVILSKGTLDMAYPALTLAHAARAGGIEATVFFTFWGLNVVVDEKVDHLKLATVGNPEIPLPTVVGALPGVEHLASRLMKKDFTLLDLPGVRELLEILDDAGAELWADAMAMKLFERSPDDLVPQVRGVLGQMDFLDRAEGAQLIFV